MKQKKESIGEKSKFNFKFIRLLIITFLKVRTAVAKGL